MRTWLYQSATNRCLTEVARQSRRVLPRELVTRSLIPMRPCESAVLT